MSLRGQPFRFSDLLSLILNPSVWTAVLACFFAVRYEPQGVRRIAFAVFAVLILAVIPVGQLFLLKAKGRLSDLEMHVRTEREAVYRLLAAEYGAGALALFAAGARWPLWGLLAVHVPNTLLLVLINRRLKISIHTMVLTCALAAAMVFFGPGVAPLGLAVLAAAWARWDAGNHTPAELAAGILLGGMLGSAEFLALKSILGG